MSAPQELVKTPALNPATRSLSRIIADEDWDDPGWARFLELTASSDASGNPPHDIGVWERTHLLYGLDRCGKLTGSSRILVAATMPDEIIALLSEYAGRVEVVGLQHGSGPRGAAGRLFWSNGALYARDRLIVHERNVEGIEEAAYDAVVFPHSAICSAGIAGIAPLMAKAEQLLVPGGVLAFKADILAGNEPDADHLDAALLAEQSLVSKIESETGFIIDGGFDAGAPWFIGGRRPDTGSMQGEAELFRNYRGRLAATSLWFLHKRGPTPEGGWDRINQWLVQRLLGEQLHRLQLGPAGRRDESGRIETDGLKKGCVFFGPYLVLPRGRYEAVLQIEPLGNARRGQLMLDVAAGGKRLFRQDVTFPKGYGVTVRLPFALPEPRLGDIERVEIRAWSTSCQATFMACRLNMI
jgi:hypothetical protein